MILDNHIRDISYIFQFYLKLSYSNENNFLLLAGFELQTLLLVSDADTLTNWAIAHWRQERFFNWINNFLMKLKYI